ncbi:50S ribosomal protein L24 [Deltaproteobacteria bacterium PRO3]|nr:50S ribosomal protein L24 [Deltaproteobacteria bacterium PRO3]
MPKQGHIRKNDQVMVITGRDKGKIGRVLRVLPKEGRVVVEKVNVVKRHTKPSAKNRQGGILEKELSIHVSNVMLLDPKKAEPTRVGFKVADGKKVRVSKKSKEVIEAKK